MFLNELFYIVNNQLLDDKMFSLMQVISLII